MKRVMVIQNTATFLGPLADFLKDHYQVILAGFETSALRIQKISPDLIVMGATEIEKMSSLIRAIRTSNELRNVGVLIVTSDLDSIQERALYEFGADLVLNPPLDFQKVHNMIFALLSRASGFKSHGHKLMKLEELELDRHTRRLRIHNQERKLSQIQVKILECFLLHPNQLLTRDFLRKQIWDLHKISNRSIDAQISKLRKLAPPLEKYILSIYAKGYVFNLPKKQARAA